MKSLRIPYLILAAAAVLLAAASCKKERSTDYDIVALDFTGVYNGAIGNNGECNYYICLSDQGFSTSGEPVPGASYYYFDIFSSAPTELSQITVPTGLYTLGARGATAVGTFTPDYSRFYQSGRYDVPTELVFSDGYLEVNRDDSGRYTFEAELTDVAGMTHHLFYSGPATLTDNSPVEFKDLNTDLNIPAVNAIASKTDMPGLDQDISNVIISLTDMSSNQQGYVIPPGSIINMDCYMTLTQDGRLQEGRYTISPDKWGEEPLTLSPGETSTNGYYVGTIAEHYTDSKTGYLGFVNDGFMTVQNSGSEYTIRFEFKTTTGHSVNGHYTGPITIQSESATAAGTDTGAAGRLHRPVFRPMTHSHFPVRPER